MSILLEAWAWITAAENWLGARGVLVTNPQGNLAPARDSILGLTIEHLIMTAGAVVVASAVALPVGLWLGHLRRGGVVTVVVSNLSRAIPTLALLMLFAASAIGFGNRATIIAVAVFTIPPILSNAYTGMVDVDAELREAASGQGMTRWQVISRLELPLAWPLIAAGLRVATVQAIATIPLAALVAGGGLGVIINAGFATQRYGQALAGAVLVAGFCLGVDWALGRLERRYTPAFVTARAAGAVA